MIKVLQLTYSLKAAGIETFAVNLYKHIDRKEIQFDFVSYFPPEKREFYEEEVRNLGSKVYKLGYKKRGKVISNLKARSNLYQCIRNNQYDIIHIHGSSGLAFLDAIIVKMAGSKKIIIHSHNTNIAKDVRMGRVLKILTFICRPLWKFVSSDMLACSAQAARWLYGKNNTNLARVIPNGVDTSRFYPQRESGLRWRKRHNIQRNMFLIGHIASFTVAKNQKFSLEILKVMSMDNSNVKLLFIGDGPQRTLIEKQAIEMGVIKDCIFNGVSNKVEEIINACDVLILPSFYEGLPVVCIEAQYCGVPIIVSDVVTDEAKISNNIYFVSLNESPRKWVDIILSLKGQKKSIQVKDNKFDIQNVADLIMKLYQEELK